MGEQTYWRQCNICKSPIGYGHKHYICSVSTCNRKRTGMVFCAVACFDAHLPMMRHRDAWAEEVHAPTKEQAEREAAIEQNAQNEASRAAPQRRIAAPPIGAQSDNDVLIVASKLKKFVREASGMNTSDTVFPVLSRHLRELSVAALRHAATEGRKTVLDRDYEAVLKKPA